jgi:hypothetical protein
MGGNISYFELYVEEVESSVLFTLKLDKFVIHITVVIPVWNSRVREWHFIDNKCNASIAMTRL